MVVERLSMLVPNGVKDLSQQGLENKQQMLGEIARLFKENGYREVQTPIFEYYDLFKEIKGTLEMDRMIKVIDTDGKVLVLRPDATIPIARMAASQGADPQELRRFSYVTSIFRMADDPHNVQSSEFTQAGVELFGDGGTGADVEVVALAISCLQKVGVSEFTFDLGQAKFFKALLAETSLTSEEQADLQRLIEHKNFADLKRLVDTLAIPNEVRQALRAIPKLYGPPEMVLKKARSVILNAEMETSIAELADVYAALTEAGCGGHLTIDLGLMGNLKYYTGVLFQGYVMGYGKPIVLGGRYDGLGKYFGCDIKATGFAIYVDDLIAAVKNQERLTRNGLH